MVASDPITALDPADFAFPSSDISHSLLSIVRNIYNQRSHSIDASIPEFGTLKEIPEGLDAEQIWAILEERYLGVSEWAKDGLDALEDALGGMGLGDEHGHEESESEDGEEEEEEVSESESGSEGLNAGLSEEEEEDASADEVEGSEIVSDDEKDAEDDHIDNSDDEESIDDGEGTGLNDAFFSFKEMEKFADHAENGQDDVDDDEVDYFQDPDEMQMTDEEGGNSDDNANDVRYDDFFRPPKQKQKVKKNANLEEALRKIVERKDDVDMESESDKEDEDPSRKRKRVQFANVDDDMEGLDVESGSDAHQETPKRVKTSDLFAAGSDNSEDESSTRKSAFEKQQEKLASTIQQLEAEIVAPKAWTMMGEASAKRRPQNSLLEHDLEFDHASKTVPVITVEKTQTLEDLIRSRILDGNFNDVERKRDPKEKPFRPSERIEIDEEKSKKSLAELYEADYLEQNKPKDGATAVDPKIQAQHDAITQLAKSLFRKLDALSSFHHRPHVPDVEVKVLKDVSAIEMEEAIPVAMADASQLAPHEVYEKPRGDVKGETELDKEERRRLRNRKKHLAKARKVAKGESGGKADAEKAKEAAVNKMVKVIDKKGHIKDASKPKKSDKR